MPQDGQERAELCSPKRLWNWRAERVQPSEMEDAGGRQCDTRGSFRVTPASTTELVQALLDKGPAGGAWAKPLGLGLLAWVLSGEDASGTEQKFL